MNEYLGTFNGFQIIEDSRMVDAIEDWSNVRSPSRAARRRWKHPQRITIAYVPKKEAYRVGNKLLMHPSLARELMKSLP